MHRPVIGILGLGRVGQVLFQVLRARGYSVCAVYNRTSDTARSVVHGTDARVVASPTELVQICELVILCVTDDAIELVADEMRYADWAGKALIHVSGAKSVDVLQSVRLAGAMVGTLHPALPFADVAKAMRQIIGATFAIESSHEVLRDWLVEMVTAFEGHVLEIPAGKKAQYHLALVMASNYMVTLYAIAEELLREFSQDDEANHQVLDTLVTATVENLSQQHTPMALTGPLVRGDIKTLDAHLDVIRDEPLLFDTYINLARLSYPMLEARGTDIPQIETLFKEKYDASDDS